MLKLTKIYDSHSSYKSPYAIQIIAYLLEKYDIEYIEHIKYEFPSNCENNLTSKFNKKTINGSPINCCNRAIFDVFELTHIDGTVKKIGNTCIQRLIEEDLINISKEEFTDICKILKTDAFCLFCFKKQKNGYHKTCLSGVNRNIKVSVPQILLHNLVNNIIKNKYQVKNSKMKKRFCKFFKNLTYLKNIDIGENSSKRTYNALCKFQEENSIILDNVDLLLELKNNCIINTLRTNTRSPSIKQLAMVHQIVINIKFIKQIDDEYTNLNYIKYGFVFPPYK